MGFSLPHMLQIPFKFLNFYIVNYARYFFDFTSLRGSYLYHKEPWDVSSIVYHSCYSYSFCGSRAFAWPSQVLCLGSHKAIVRVWGACVLRDGLLPSLRLLAGCLFSWLSDGSSQCFAQEPAGLWGAHRSLPCGLLWSAAFFIKLASSAWRGGRTLHSGMNMRATVCAEPVL